MKRALSLGMYILNRINYPKKFGLILLLFMIPLSTLIYMTINNAINEVNSSKQEQTGIEYISHVRSFIQHVQQHRGLTSSYLGGQNDAKDKMSAKQAEIAQDIQAIDSMDQQYGESIKATQEWRAIKQKWESLVNDLYDLPLQEATSRHTQLIAETLDLKVTIADFAGLLTESDPENNHLVQTVVFKLPWSTEYMGQARAVGSGVVAKKSMTKDEETNLIYLKRAIEKELRDAEKNMNIALSNNEQLRTQLEQLNTKAFDASTSLIQMMDKNILNTPSITMKADEYYSYATETINSVYDLLNAESVVLNDLLQERIDNLKKDQQLLIALTILVLLLIVYLFAAFYLAIKETISTIQKATQKIAQGDLTEKVIILTKDETAYIGESLNTMIDSLQDMIKGNKMIATEVAASSQELSAITDETTQATNQIATAMQIVANGAEKQQVVTEDTNRSMEEMSAGMQRIAETSTTVAQESRGMATEAESGSVSIQKAIQQMNSINQSVQQSSSLVTTLGERSDEIGKILDVITTIASQTNLLALNAAIEAARAGEHGRGFSIVAEEVRKLAEQSEVSAQQIASLIRDIQEDTKRSVDSMNRVTKEVSEGTIIVHKSGDAFSKIVKAAQLVAREIQEVSVISEQMSAGSQQVLASVNQLSHIAKEASANAQTVAASSEEQLASMEEVTATVYTLTMKAQELQQMIERYQV